MSDSAPINDAQTIPETPAAKARRWPGLMARIGISGGILAILIPKISSSGVNVPNWTGVSGLWIVGALALTMLSIVMSAWRWQTVLEAMGRPTRLPRLLNHYLAGQFIAGVAPAVGGDVLRVSRLAKDNGRMPDSFASVVLERLTGWLVLPLITFLGLLINPPLRDLGQASQVAVAVALTTLVGLAFILVAVAANRFGEVDAEKGAKRFLAAISLGLRALREQPRAAIKVIGVGFAYQLVLVAAAVMVARGLGIKHAGPTALLAFFPAVAIAQALPFSIAGLGVREGLFALFLRPLGIPAGQAAALGLVLFLLNLLVSLMGAPAFAMGGRVGPPDTLAPTAAVLADDASTTDFYE